VLPAARAEVSVDPYGPFPGTVQIIVLGITEGPDPFGLWEQVRDIEPERILNVDGAARGDGRPDVAEPGAGHQIVAWAYRTGTDYDIAVSEWTSDGWSEPEFLSDETTNELDPRVFVREDGTVHVVWWVEETERVYIATRTPDSNIWIEPLEVTPPATRGRRPSVAVWEGLLHVAYERTDPTDSSRSEIVVMRRQGIGAAFYERVIGEVPRTRPLDVMLHVHESVIWADWKHHSGDFGYSRGWADGWDPIRTTPWLDPSWVGVEETRAKIRSLVLDPVQGDPVGQDTGGDGSSEPDDSDRYVLPVRNPDPSRDIGTGHR
jgi:hypothetical protein